MMTTTATKFHN